MNRGKIVDLRGTWFSGLANIVLETETSIVTIPCDNAATVRALEAIFGNVIQEGHTVDVEAIRGKEIYYGLGKHAKALIWIRPVEGS